MSDVDELVRARFHDSVLNKILHQNQDIILDLEYYNEEDIVNEVKVAIRGIELIKRDNLVVKNIDMEGDHGSVIWLYMKSSSVTLGLNWRRYPPVDRNTCVYDLLGSNVRIEIEQTQWKD